VDVRLSSRKPFEVENRPPSSLGGPRGHRIAGRKAPGPFLPAGCLGPSAWFRWRRHVLLLQRIMGSSCRPPQICQAGREPHTSSPLPEHRVAEKARAMGELLARPRSNRHLWPCRCLPSARIEPYVWPVSVDDAFCAFHVVLNEGNASHTGMVLAVISVHLEQTGFFGGSPVLGYIFASPFKCPLWSITMNHPTGLPVLPIFLPPGPRPKSHPSACARKRRRQARSQRETTAGKAPQWRYRFHHRQST